MAKILDNSPLLMLILGVLIVAVSVLILNYAFQPTMDGIEWQEETYIVMSGDSLWAISKEYCPEGVDCREWIEEIRALNDLPDSNIHPGQTLIVLAPVKEG